MSQMATGGYVRHRNRMIQESVFQDLRDTLIACRWMSGTTSHEVVDPENPAGGWQILTTTVDEVLKLVGKREDGDVAEVVLIDFFPEAGGTNDGENPEGEVQSRKTERNTLAVNSGEAQDPEFVELGSNMQEQQYIFTMAFYASSDAVALAVLNDLRDRYMGRLVSDDNLNLYNYNDPNFDNDTPPVARMEIDAFRYQMNTDTQVSAAEVHLYFAELVLTDVIDAQVPTSVSD